MSDDNVIDIATRKKLEKVDTPEGETAQKFMRRWSKTIKDGKFNSVAIVVMDENRFCDWGILCQDELQQAIFTLLLEDIRNELKDNIFEYEDLESD